MRSAILLAVVLVPASLFAQETGDHAQAKALFAAAQARLDEMGLPRREPAFAALRVALSALEGRSAVTALTVTPLAFGKQVVLEWQGPKGPVRTTLVSSEPHVAPEWRLVSSSKAGGPSLHLDSAEHFPSIVVFPNRPGRAPAKIIYTEGPDGTLRRELGVIGKGGITTEVTHVRKGPRARDGAWRPRGR